MFSSFSNVLLLKPERHFPSSLTDGNTTSFLASCILPTQLLMVHMLSLQRPWSHLDLILLYPIFTPAFKMLMLRMKLYVFNNELYQSGGKAWFCSACPFLRVILPMWPVSSYQQFNSQFAKSREVTASPRPLQHTTVLWP